MSTRANIIITDSDDELIFYRHSDGYPEGTLPTLQKFIDWVKVGLIRDNVGQAAGWLILIGAEEYRDHCSYPPQPGIYGWKCGAYEPTCYIHSDIEFLYVVDLAAKVVHIDGQDGYKYSGAFERLAV